MMQKIFFVIKKAQRFIGILVSSLCYHYTLHSGQNEYYVLSVGCSRNGAPLVTISENEKPICYRLPDEYGEWAMNVVGMANMGER